MSFERPNLHFAVRKKHSQLAANFGDLVEEAEKKAALGEAMDPTIVYTLTRREAQDVAAALQVG